MRDPTIPTSGTAVRAKHLFTQAVTGRLIDGGESVRLVDKWGNDWGADSVKMLAGSFGSKSEGWRKAPRPYKYVPGTTEILVQGDDLLIVFPDGDPTQPIVIGALWSLEDADDGLLTGLQLDDAAADANKGIFRLNAVDASTGLPTGHVTVSVLDGGNAVEIGVGVVNGVNLLRLRIDASGLSILIGAGAESQRVVLGDTYMTDLQGVLSEIIAIGAGIPASTPIPTPNATAMLTKVATSLGVGLPYLSPIVKVQ